MSQVVMNGCGERERTRCFSLMSVVMLHHSIYWNSTCGLKLWQQITISLFKKLHTHEYAHKHTVMLIPWLWRHQRGCVTQVAAMPMKKTVCYLEMSIERIFYRIWPYFNIQSPAINHMCRMWCHTCLPYHVIFVFLVSTFISWKDVF